MEVVVIFLHSGRRANDKGRKSRSTLAYLTRDYTIITRPELMTRRSTRN